MIHTDGRKTIANQGTGPGDAIKRLQRRNSSMSASWDTCRKCGEEIPRDWVRNLYPDGSQAHAICPRDRS